MPEAAGAMESRPPSHVDSAGIRDFFSRNGHRFDYTLKPGEAFFPISTA